MELIRNRPRFFSKRFFMALPALLAAAGAVFLSSFLPESRTLIRARMTGTFSFPSRGLTSFVPAGNGLAAASTERWALFDASGRVIAEESRAAGKPACSFGKDTAVFYDAGSPGLTAVRTDGSIFREKGDAILYAESSGGFITAVTESSDRNYYGNVLVYDSSLTALLRLRFAQHIPTAAKVTDGGVICVSLINERTAAMRFYERDGKERGSCTIPGVIHGFELFADETVAVITDNGLLFLNTQGETLHSLSFGGLYPVAYALGDAAAYIALSPSPSGGGTLLLAVSEDGSLLGQSESERDVYAISAAGSRVLLLYGDELTLCDEFLGELVSRQNTDSIRQAFLRKDGIILAAGAAGAEVLYFGR